MIVRLQISLLATLVLASCAEEGKPPLADGTKNDHERATPSKDGGDLRDSGDPRDDDDTSHDDERGNGVDDGGAAAADDETPGDQTSGARDVDASTDGAADHEQDADQGETGADGGSDDAGDDTADDDPCHTLTYDVFGETFMNKYCVACHAPGKLVAGAPDLTTLKEIARLAKIIKKEAVSDKTMPLPQSPAPSDEERKELGEWLDCGPN